MKNNRKGFTLAELLIVVAIIAVLVAIAIPVFSSSLTKAKEAADEANVRANYAEAVTAALVDGADYPANYSGPTLNFTNKLTWTSSGSGLSITYAATTIDPLNLTAAPLS